MKFEPLQKSNDAGVPILRAASAPMEHFHPHEPFPGGDPGAGAADGDAKFDVLVYLRLFLKYWKLMAGFVGVVLLLTLIGSLLVTPIYRATAMIQIDRQAMRVMQNESSPSDEFGGRDTDFFQTQYQLLQSRSLAERAVTGLNLADNPRFLAAATPSMIQRVKRFFSRAPTAESEVDALARKRMAVAKLASSLTIEPVIGTRLVKIHYFDPDPKLAQTVVNGFAENFISDNLERRYESSSYARTFLEERLQQLKVKLEESEKEAVAYAAREQIVSADDKQSLAGANLTAINTALTGAKADRIKAEQIWAMAQSDNIYGLPQILDNKSMQGNREKRTALASDYQQKLTYLKPGFPEMLAIKAQIDELDRQAGKIINVIRESIRTQFQGAKIQEAELEKQLEQKKAEVINQRGRSIKYNILQREVETNRSLYDGLLQRYKEIGVAGSLGANNISIIDRSETPGGPHSPKIMLNLLIAGFAGLLLAGGGVLILEQLDNTIKTPEDVETQLKLSVIGVIPFIEGKEADMAKLLGNERSPVSEAFRSFQTSLQFVTAAGMPKSLSITSTKPAEGKSTIAATLARTCARLGARVLLIDGDLRKPSLHIKMTEMADMVRLAKLAETSDTAKIAEIGLDTRLELTNSVGLSNYLTGTMQPDDAIQRTDIDTLYFMASGPVPPNPADLLAGPKLASLLALGGEFFELIIVDAPPVLGLADAPLIGNAVDGMLIVVTAGETRRQNAQMGIKRLRMARTQILGAVLNRFQAKHAGYGYGYGGYGYSNEGYYGYGADNAVTPKQEEGSGDVETLEAFPPKSAES